MKPKLISFKLCPFVQRATIVLEHKRVEHDIEYIDLANPPAWFIERSPLKKVPVLLVDENVLFESMAINEYLDEAYPNRLHPHDIILRAKNRSWIEFGSECLWDVFHLSVKETEREFNEVREGLLSKFDHLEKAVIAAPFFNGAAFSLVDAGYAPLLQRLEYLDKLRPGIFDGSRHPNINTWKNNLLKLDTVRKSCVPEISALYHEQLWKRQGYISRFLDKTKYSGDVVRSIY
ncbi:MAG: glutathione S-transferase family protein [Gammaproteobacteria bacterium]|nr:glutathione S-transferase family protein [Gammaproteobacteria bacterium]